MLNMSEKLSDAGLVVPRPARTTFPDGRMATKEAWNYCTAVCKKRKLQAPTLRTFKWHLKHGNLIKAAQVPNPFGGAGPDKVYAITCEAVVAFVDELQKSPNNLEVVEQPSAASPASPKKEAKRKATSAKTKDDEKELTSKEAFAYVHRNAKGRTDLNSTTFGFYLTYDLISSRLENNQRRVRVGDLDAFLELAPDGVYANHIDYLVAPSRGPGDLSLKEAYDYYCEVDPNPLTLTTFRSIVATGILPAIRTANNPKAPVVGFRRQDINAFLAMRQRLQEEANRAAEARKQKRRKDDDSRNRSRLVAKVMEDVLEKAKPILEKTKGAAKAKTSVPKAAPQPTPKPVRAPKKPSDQKPAAPDPRWVPTKDAYAYYEERSERPFTDSWFRDKVYRGDLFRTKIEKDERPNNPSGKKYFVDLNSIDEYLTEDPKTKPKPQKAWPVEKAYHKFSHLIPAGLSLLQFKRLVNTGLIRSFTRNSVVHVRLDAVEAYFDGLAEVDADAELQMGPAYDYYCSRCSDPVAKAHFSRWVSNGEIEGGTKNDEGLWVITMGHIDDFIEKYPSGRMRTNRNSRVVSESRAAKRRKKKDGAGPSKPPPPLPEVSPDAVPQKAAEGSKGTVSISMSDYDSPVEMAKALEVLTNQGFEVSVKP